MAVDLALTRPKLVVTNAVTATVSAGTPVEVDTGGEESIFIPFSLASTDPASFTVPTVTTVSGNAVITTTGGGFANVKVGDVLSGTGITGSPTVISKTTNNNSLTMSANASASGTVTLTVDRPAGTPTLFAFKAVFSAGGSSFSILPKLYIYDGSLPPGTPGTAANSTKTIDLVDKAGSAIVIDIDSFLGNFGVAKSA